MGLSVAAEVFAVRARLAKFTPPTVGQGNYSIQGRSCDSYDGEVVLLASERSKYALDDIFVQSQIACAMIMTRTFPSTPVYFRDFLSVAAPNVASEAISQRIIAFCHLSFHSFQLGRHPLRLPLWLPFFSDVDSFFFDG